MSKLRFYWGCMGSAKTLRLLTTAYNFEERGISFLVCKPRCDNRDGDKIKSRIGIERECVLIDEDIDLFETVKNYKNALSVNYHKLEWLLIDECQFLAEKQINQLAQIVDELNVEVICFGLRTDFTSHLFPASKRLFEIADEFEEIKSTCSCGRKNLINARFDENGNILLDGEQILIGGNDVYKPLCRKCWNNKIKKKNHETSN